MLGFGIPVADNSMPLPAGTIFPWTGNLTNGVPVGWLNCDGAAVSRTTYARLLGQISFLQSCTTTNANSTLTVVSSVDMAPTVCDIEGTNLQTATSVSTVTNATTIVMTKTATAGGATNLTFFPYGNGDGSTTFNLPDLRGLVPVGAGTGSGVASLTKRYVGQYSGEENHTLTTPEIPSHTHTYNTSSGDNAAQGPTAPVTLMYAKTSQTSGSTGGGGSHNNMQPYNVVYYIIKI